MTRGLSVSELYNKKRKTFEFSGSFKDLIGNPEQSGTWIVWGDSGNGKTSFVCQLAKFLTRYGRVLYNSMEEADGESIKAAFVRASMQDVKTKITLLPNESMEDLKVRLRKKNAPRIVIVDSIQYSELRYGDYKRLKEEFKKVLFIFVSHEENKLPEGKVAKRVRYDAMVKIRVLGFMATATSRYLATEGQPYTIWKTGA